MLNIIKYDNANALEATWLDADSKQIASIAYADSQINLLRADVVKYGGDITPFEPLIADVEANIQPYVAPVRTLEEQAEDVRIALQAAIDEKAKTFGFISGGNALMLYAGFVNPFQSLAQTFAVWEASVWFEAETYRQEVIAGTKPMLTPEEAIALMPVYPS